VLTKATSHHGFIVGAYQRHVLPGRTNRVSCHIITSSSGQGRFKLQQFGVASGEATSVFGGQEFRMMV